MSNFIIHALPRSRTAWLSRFLTYKDHTCHHEIAQTMKTVEDYSRLISTPDTGSAETGAAQGWWLIQHASPGIKTVVVRRPLDEIIQSTLDIDLRGVASYDKDLLTRHFSYGEKMLDKISRHHGVLTVNFHDLNKLEVCKKVFEHCLPYQFDVRWWGSLKNQNIQVNMRNLLKDYYKNKEDIDRFKSLCKSHLRYLRKTDPDNLLWKDN